MAATEEKQAIDAAVAAVASVLDYFKGKFSLKKEQNLALEQFCKVEDYAEVIKEPMDLATILSKIDRHQYGTVREFLYDVDLIWKNCLEYNPDRDPSDRQIRHRACALKDTVHAIIKHELDEDFEKICEEIKESRSKRDLSTSRSAPSFYHVLPKQPKASAVEAKTSDVAPAQAPVQPTCTTSSSNSFVITTPKNTAQKKKRRQSRWSKGMISKKKSTCSPHTPKEEEEEEEEEEAGGTESDEGSAGEREVDQCAQEEPEDRRGGVPTEAGQQDASPKPNNSPQTATNTGVMDESVKQHAGGQSSENGGQNVELKEASAEEQSDLVTCEDEGDIAPSKETEPADPMDVEVCEGSGPAGLDSCVPPSQLTHNGTTGKMDEDSHAESSVRRVTRGKTAVLQQQQQQMVDAEAAVQVLVQKTPPLEVDRNKLKDLLEKIVTRTESYEVQQLEKLYALLCQSIYRHRQEYNKATLLKEMEQEIDDLTTTILPSF